MIDLYSLTPIELAQLWEFYRLTDATKSHQERIDITLSQLQAWREKRAADPG